MNEATQVVVEQPVNEEAILFNDKDNVVTFGGREYRFRKPTMRRAREWRGKVIQLIDTIREKVGSGESETKILAFLNQEYSEQMIALIVEFCGPESGLNAETIDEQGTDDELVVAWNHVCKVGRFPFDRIRSIVGETQ